MVGFVYQRSDAGSVLLKSVFRLEGALQPARQRSYNRWRGQCVFRFTRSVAKKKIRDSEKV